MGEAGNRKLVAGAWVCKRSGDAGVAGGLQHEVCCREGQTDLGERGSEQSSQAPGLAGDLEQRTSTWEGSQEGDHQATLGLQGLQGQRVLGCMAGAEHPQMSTLPRYRPTQSTWREQECPFLLKCSSTALY